MRIVAIVSLLLLPAIAGSAAESEAPVVTITPIGAPETVFDWRRDRCETIDTPDAPARAFRDAAGAVHLIASHYVVRQMVGPSLTEARRRCDVVFRSTLAKRYEDYRGYQWLTGFYTTDGRTVHALVHDEFHGSEQPALCPSGVFYRCWWNSITAAVSIDGGNHFHEAAPENRLVAVLPYRYAADVENPAGYFSPSNVVAKDGAYYAVIKATPYRAQRNGSCLLRTADLSNWHAWNGSGFDARFVPPHAATEAEAGVHVCAPLDQLSMGDVGGLSRDASAGTFVAVMQGLLPGNAGAPVCGIWATASRDLIAWSRPTMVWHDPHDPAKCDPASDLYPSILDPTSASRNFETFGATPYIYFVRENQADPPYDRTLLRQPVRIDFAEPSATLPLDKLR